MKIVLKRNSIRGIIGIKETMMRWISIVDEMEEPKIWNGFTPCHRMG